MRHDVAQRGDLADHVHAAGVLVFIRYRNQAGRIWFGSRGWRLAVDTFRLAAVDVLVAATIHRTPVESLGGDAQPADVHPFQGPDDLLVGLPLACKRRFSCSKSSK